MWQKNVFMLLRGQKIKMTHFIAEARTTKFSWLEMKSTKLADSAGYKVEDLTPHQADSQF